MARSDLGNQRASGPAAMWAASMDRTAVGDSAERD